MPKTLSSRSMRAVLILPAAILCLVASAQAQHGGGGGGHFGGGHFGGGGHSSHAHASAGHGGHRWSWLHFGSRRRSGREQQVSRNSANESRLSEMIGTGNALHAMPSTYIRTISLRSLMSSPPGRFSTYTRFRHRSDYSFRGFQRVRGSGCSFNGFSQVCFFEPAWPLLWFSAGFDYFPFDWGFSDDTSSDTTDALASGDMTAPPVPESEPPENSPNSSISSKPPIRGQDLDPRFFVLILKNGTDHVVTDYWLSDGYIEYVSRDGSQSHIPANALDLEETVRNNAARGLNFVLRSAP